MLRILVCNTYFYFNSDNVDQDAGFFRYNKGYLARGVTRRIMVIVGGKHYSIDTYVSPQMV